MKKNTKKVAVMLLVGVVAVGSYFVSGTYAKYTSTVTGTDTAKVAKWAWEINDVALAANTTTYTLDLFSTVKDSNGTATEDDMVTSSHMIAPGTSGSFQIKVENLSDVDANVSVDFSEDKGTAVSNANIEYAVKVGDGAIGAYGNVDSLDQTVTELVNTSGSKTITVYWRWLYQVQDTGSDPATYDDQDAIDTAVGFAAASAATDADRTITVNAEIKLVQID